MTEHNAEKETPSPSGQPPGGEDLFRRLVEFAGQGIGWANLDGSVAYMNPTLRRMLDMEPEEDVSRYGMSQFYRPEDLTGVVRDMLTTARERGSWSGEVVLMSVKGRGMPTLHDIHLIRDEAGAPLAFACAITDLTRLKESESTLRAIYERVQEGILVASAANRCFLMANPAMCRMLGYSEAELLGLSPEELHPPEALPRVREIFQAMERGEFRLVKELPMRHKDGNVLYADVNPTLVELAGQPAFLGVFRDTTEQKRVQAALRHERNFTNAILDNAGALVVVLDREGRIRRFNRAAEELTGYSFAEAEGRFVWDFLLLPEERATVKQEAFQALAEHPERLADKYTNYWLAKDGERSLIEWHNTVLMDSQGAMEFMVSIGIDVTEQRMVEAALRRSEETYARAEAIAHIGSWDWDMLSGDLRWTNEIYRIFGRTPQSFAATYQAFLDILHPEDRQRVVAAVNASVADAHIPYSVEHRVVRPSGEVRIVHERGKVYRDEQGRAVRMIGTVHDITERKQAEDELRRAYGEHRAVTQAIRDNLYMLDDKGRLVWWNREVEVSTGLAPEALAGKYGPDFFVPEDRARVEAALFKAAQEGYAEVEARFITVQGPVYYHFNGMPVLDESGLFLGIAGAGRDISDRKQAEDELKRLNEELEARVKQRTAELSAAKEEAERANRSKSDFLSRMSHELRTPLNAILGFGQLLEIDPSHPLHETQRDSVREILHGGRHLLELINEVLDLARVESGRLTVDLAPVDLKPLLQECLSLVGPLAESHGIRVLDETPAHCGMVVRADRMRLKQVLLNLLSNAVKYNRAQGSVTVACAREGEGIRVDVRDTGPGLTQSQQNLLFRPFERLGADRTAIEGSGIGLALCKRLMEAMEGEIGVRSALGTGSTFWLRCQASAEQAGEVEAAAPEPAPPAASGQARILYIEDNPANLRLMERALGKQPELRLMTADRPGIGLELAMAHRPDLILLDINLPDMDGYQVLTLLRSRQETRSIPVIGISANAMPQDLERARAAGFTDYLTKPLEIPQLLRAIHDTLATAPPNATQ